LKSQEPSNKRKGAASLEPDKILWKKANPKTIKISSKISDPRETSAHPRKKTLRQDLKVLANTPTMKF
jgi:hypothetical protein